MGALGLPSDMMLIGQTLPPEFLDFAWHQFWWRSFAGERPYPSASGKKRATKAEKEAALKIQDMQKQMNPQIEAAKTEPYGGNQKSRSADGRRKKRRTAWTAKLTPIESNLIIL